MNNTDAPGQGSHLKRTLVLASQSPRRVELLREAGFEVVVARSAFVDDPTPPQGHDPLLLAVELASRKAINVVMDGRWHDPVVIGADTISIGLDGALLGQPQSRQEAGAMIRSFLNHTHHVVTGVALWSPVTGQQEVFADVAQVWLGSLSEDQLEAYLATDLWRGKAGGYNLAHVHGEGWPVEVTGDETTVLGLPMQRVVARLAAWRVCA